MLPGVALAQTPAAAATAAPQEPAATAVDAFGLLPLIGTVLRVEVQRPEGGYAMGSAVALAPELVVTNCHVTRRGASIRVLKGGRRFLARAERRDTAHDLCALQVPGLEARPASLALDEVLPRQPVHAVGYSGGLALQRSDGWVETTHPLDGAAMIRSTNWFNSGASGGGLFDAAGRLVGILTFRMRGGDAHYFSAPAAWLPPLLDGSGFEALNPPSQAPAEPPAEAPARATAYWEQPLARQPWFLQAYALERQQQWPALEALALAWAAAEAASPEPLAMVGLARWRQGRSQDGEAALHAALALDPAHSAAWYVLASLYSSVGRPQSFLDAYAALKRNDPRRAALLASLFEAP